MEPIRDPEGAEIEFLRRTGAILDRKVIEIGCGNGRLTWRYADLAAAVAGVDPDLERLAEMNGTRPETVAKLVPFAQAAAEMLPFPSEAFETAFFSWSF
jgi:ubiquinone/menaquinone biosynthesis C-methylase UbiE